MMTENWCVEKALMKAVNRAFQSPEFPQRPPIINAGNSEITIVELEDTLVKAARIVQRHGDDYLDYFLLIQRELEIRKSKEEALEEVKRLASSGTTLQDRDPIQP